VCRRVHAASAADDDDDDEACDDDAVALLRSICTQCRPLANSLASLQHAVTCDETQSAFSYFSIAYYSFTSDSI